MNEILLESMLCDSRLVFAVSGRLMFHKVEHACLLAECGTDAARKFGEVVGGIEQAVSQLPIALV